MSARTKSESSRIESAFSTQGIDWSDCVNPASADVSLDLSFAGQDGAPRTALKVPDDAVLDSGTRKVVFVAKGEGVLEPREVTVGEQGGGAWEILSGLVEGEEIALGASFLVDSESRLASALAGMRDGTGAPPARESHAAPGPSPSVPSPSVPGSAHQH